MELIEATVLLVEDDENLAFMLSENLEIEGFNVVKLSRGEEVLLVVRERNVDIVLMDIDLDGGMSGFETAENLRLYYPDLPIIFTTGKTHFRDVDRGLKLGNVDYQKKPYGSRELISRITNLLRRKPKNEPNVYVSGGFSFDPTNHIVQIDSNQIKFTKSEAAFLSLLCSKMNAVVSKDELASHLWGEDDSYPKDHSLNNLSHRIRKYIEGNPYVEIKTISKVGYRLVEKK